MSATSKSGPSKATPSSPGTGSASTWTYSPRSRACAECRTLTLGHVDMMFHVLCKLGYGVSLDAAARGMGLAGKPEGMNGRARSRALGGGEAGGGAAVRRSGREDDAGRWRPPARRAASSAGSPAAAGSGRCRCPRDGWRSRRLWDCRSRTRPGWTSRGRGRSLRGGWTG